ncbi:hypothetical protein ACTFIW_007087 [Dictyostelium discoideum]
MSLTMQQSDKEKASEKPSEAIIDEKDLINQQTIQNENISNSITTTTTTTKPTQPLPLSAEQIIQNNSKSTELKNASSQETPSNPPPPPTPSNPQSSNPQPSITVTKESGMEPDSPTISSTKKVKYFPLTPYLDKLDQIKKVQEISADDMMNDPNLLKMFDDDKMFLSTPEKNSSSSSSSSVSSHSDRIDSSGEVEFFDLYGSLSDSDDSRVSSPSVDLSDSSSIASVSLTPIINATPQLVSISESNENDLSISISTSPPNQSSMKIHDNKKPINKGEKIIQIENEIKEQTYLETIKNVENTVSKTSTITTTTPTPTLTLTPTPTPTPTTATTTSVNNITPTPTMVSNEKQTTTTTTTTTTSPPSTPALTPPTTLTSPTSSTSPTPPTPPTPPTLPTKKTKSSTNKTSGKKEEINNQKEQPSSSPSSSSPSPSSSSLKKNIVQKQIKKIKVKIEDMANKKFPIANSKRVTINGGPAPPDDEYYQNLLEYLKEGQEFKPSPLPKESLKDGHVFIVYGDLTKLVCDIRMVPCSHNVLFRDTVNGWLKPDWMLLPFEIRNKFKDIRIDFRDGKDRVYKLKDWPTEYPNISQPWLCNVVPFKRGIDSHCCAWYVKGAIDFLDKVGHDLEVNKPPIKNGRAKPLVSLPILGTGGGGGSRIAGQILSLLIHELFVATRKWKYDVVLVTNEISMYTAATNIRKELMESNPTFSSIYRNLLGDEIMKKAHTLGKLLKEDKLAIFLGAGSSRSAGLPTWTGLLDMLGAKLGMTETELRQMEQLHHLDRATVLESRWKKQLKKYSENIKTSSKSPSSSSHSSSSSNIFTPSLNKMFENDNLDGATTTTTTPTTPTTTTTTTTTTTSTTTTNSLKTTKEVNDEILKIKNEEKQKQIREEKELLEKKNREKLEKEQNFEYIHKKIYNQINVPMQTEIANLMKVSHAGLPHFLLASTPVQEIVTTNYDQCFEIASRSIGKEICVLPYHSLNGRNKRWILKLHGCVSNPQDIIITREDYIRYGDKNEALSGMVQALLITKHLLFVGFSLTDDNFYQIMSAVKRATSTGEDGSVRLKNTFGTALFLQRNDLMNEIWGKELNILYFDENKSDIAWCARKQEIFLEYLTGVCSNNNTSHLMEKRFDCLLKEGEKIFRDRLIEFVSSLPEEAIKSDAFKKFHVFLTEMGYDSRNFYY